MDLTWILLSFDKFLKIGKKLVLKVLTEIWLINVLKKFKTEHLTSGSWSFKNNIKIDIYFFSKEATDIWSHILDIHSMAEYLTLHAFSSAMDLVKLSINFSWLWYGSLFNKLGVDSMVYILTISTGSLMKSVYNLNNKLITSLSWTLQKYLILSAAALLTLGDSSFDISQ